MNKKHLFFLSLLLFSLLAASCAKYCRCSTREASIITISTTKTFSTHQCKSLEGYNVNDRGDTVNKVSCQVL